MADPVVANILKSGAIGWYAPKGEALPDETAIAAGADWGGSWLRIGFTKEPLKLMIEDEFHEKEVEEFLMAVARRRIGRKMKMETVLSELIADYMQLAVDGVVTTTAAGASQKGYEDLQAGNDSEMDEYTFGFEGIRYNASGVALPIRMGFRICTFQLNGDPEFSNRSDDYTGVPLAINALQPVDGTTPFWFQRVTAPATS